MTKTLLILALTIYFLGSLVSEPKIAMRLVESTSDLDKSMALFLAIRENLEAESILIHPIQ